MGQRGRPSLSGWQWGVRAGGEVRAGECVLQLPSGVVLDADTVLRELPYGEQLAAAQLSEQSVLAAFVADLTSAAQRGDERRWAPYAGDTASLPCLAAATLCSTSTC